MRTSTTRAAAGIGIAITTLGVAYCVAGLGGWQPDWGYLAQAVLHVGELAVVVALVAAVGAHALGRVGLAVAAIGQALLVVAELGYRADPDLAGVLFAAGPLLSGLGMVLAGTAVLRAREWPLRQRLLPLLVGVWILVPATPVMIATGGPPAPLSLAMIIVWDVLWSLTGVAVLVAARRRAPAAAL